MKIKYTLILLLLLSLCVRLEFGAETSTIDVWQYLSAKGKISIEYNYTPIQFLPTIGDGAFDRPINIHPQRRLVFVDSRLAIEDAIGVWSFWKAFDPNTPTTFAIISPDGWICEFPESFKRTDQFDNIRKRLLNQMTPRAK